MSTLKPAIGKPALDAMTDASLAWTRDERKTAPPGLLGLGEQAAAIITEQFPGQGETAGRVVMCVVQMIEGMESQVHGPEGRILGQLSGILALAAEQVVREAGER